MIRKFSPADMSEVLSILQEYGVPTYFDSVTRSDQTNGDYVSCYIGDVEFIRIYASVSGNSAPDKNSTNHTGVFVTTANGAEQGFTLGYDSVFGNIEIDSITVCDSCIVITPTAQKQNFFIICKDNDDNTAVFTITTNSQGYWTGSTGIGSNTGTTYRLWAVSVADTFIRGYTITFDNADAISESYVCSPIATAQHTLRNVYLPAVRQFYEETEPFAAEIDGYSYLCGRGFVARDSAAVDTDTSTGLDTSSFYTAAQMDTKLTAMQTEITSAAEQAAEAEKSATSATATANAAKDAATKAQTAADSAATAASDAKTTADKAQEDASKNASDIAALTESVNGLQESASTLAASQILYAAPMQDASVEGRYMLFAEYVFPRVKNYESADLTLLVRNRGVSNTAEDGILRVRLRYGKASAAFQYAQIYFPQNSGIDAAKFILCCNAAAGTAQLYLDVNTTYAGYICKVLDMGTSETIVDLGAWMLHSPTVGQTELPTEADGWTTVTAAGTATTSE